MDKDSLESEMEKKMAVRFEGVRGYLDAHIDGIISEITFSRIICYASFAISMIAMAISIIDILN